MQADGRHPPARRGSARPRLRGGRTPRRLLGDRPRALGHGRRHAADHRGRRPRRHADGRASTRRAATSSPARRRCTRRCIDCLRPHVPASLREADPTAARAFPYPAADRSGTIPAALPTGRPDQSEPTCRSACSRRNPLANCTRPTPTNELHRTLDARALVLLGIGAIIGTGIFVLTGTAAANHAGPGAGPLVPDRGPRLRARRPLLRGVRRDDPGRRAARIRIPTRRSASSSPGSSAGT